MDLPPQLFVNLKDRTLWCDGTYSVIPERAEDVLYDRFAGVVTTPYVTTITPDIRRFNRITTQQPLEVKDLTTLKIPEPSWFDEIRDIDIAEVLKQQIDQYLMSTDTPVATVTARVEAELAIFEQRGLLDMLRACIFVVNRMHSSNVVWGVGRGSAVASFVLFLIGVHDVDSFKYQLDIDEFLGERNDEHD